MIVAAVIIVPILTHSNSGSSGQEIPDDFVAESTATGEDGRTRTISVTTSSGDAADLGDLQAGDELIVAGSGFDASIGIYVSICAIPEPPLEKPGPCLGGVPDVAEGEESDGDEPLASAWVTNDWAWQAFATHSYDDADAGTFKVTLTVPVAADELLDCTEVDCALATRADHTAARERVQDMLLPIQYRAD